MRIYCLMKTGLPLSVEMCDRLHGAARQMIRRGKSKLRLRGENFEGQALTEGHHVSLGFISGVEFSAVIESQAFVTRVRFIVRTSDLEGIEDAVWSHDQQEADFPAN